MTIQCLYHLERDPQLMPIRNWTGEISVSGRVLRTFVGRINTGDSNESATWIAQPVGNLDVRCRLDTQAVAGVTDGVHDSHVAVTVASPSTLLTPPAEGSTSPTTTVVFRCPDQDSCNTQRWSGGFHSSTRAGHARNIGLTGRGRAGRVSLFQPQPRSAQLSDHLSVPRSRRSAAANPRRIIEHHFYRNDRSEPIQPAACDDVTPPNG